MTHKWSDKDDVALREAVEACLPMQETMKGGREIWWAAVCGRLGFTDVSPDAARTRWQRLRQGDTMETTEVWDRVAERVEQYEQSLLESAAYDIADVREKVNEMHDVLCDVCESVNKLVHEWYGEKDL
jgi:hypothetical protein